ncbi:MAG: hypothetical protein N2053_04735 [Chitinispirillaceae bacterium]|nr:hypothetical protein [Chitinispirillaceae bacterium]
MRGQIIPLIEKLPVWLSHRGSEGDVVISTRIRLARNIENHKFPYHATIEERKKIFNTIEAILSNKKEFKPFSLINFFSIPSNEQRILLEKRYVSPELLNIEGDRGVAIEKEGYISVMINEEDHLRLNSIDAGLTLKEIWERLCKVEEKLGNYLPFAYDPKLGFLTNCPSNCGTGLRVSYLLHLPGLVLTKTIDQVLLAASEMGIATRGFLGENSTIIGNLFLLSNRATLGLSEEEFLGNSYKIISQIISSEREARERVFKEASLELSDKVYRAWGILLYAKMLSMEEFINLSSALRLGIDSGIFKELTTEELNLLTIEIMPGHLEKHYSKKLTKDERHMLRAKRIKEFVSELQKSKIEKKKTGVNRK